MAITITDTSLSPIDGSPLAGASVTIDEVDAAGMQLATPTYGPYSTTADAAGTWSKSVQQSVHYRITVLGSAGGFIKYALAPAAGGPYDLDAILFDPTKSQGAVMLAGPRNFQVQVTDPLANPVIVEDGVAYFRVPESMNGWTLTDAQARIVDPGSALTIKLYNVTNADYMLVTPITIDALEPDSSTAAVPSVVEGIGTGGGVLAADEIRVDVTVASGDAFGLIVDLEFSLPLLGS
jgi:hypothetical protein